MEWDRERKFSELIDEKTRNFFQDLVEEACFPPWSLWEKEGLILSAKRMEAGYPETVLGPRMAEWFQLTDGGEQPDYFETERGLCLVFPVRYELDIAGALVIGPVPGKDTASDNSPKSPHTPLCQRGGRGGF